MCVLYLRENERIDGCVCECERERMSERKREKKISRCGLTRWKTYFQSPLVSFQFKFYHCRSHRKWKKYDLKFFHDKRHTATPFVISRCHRVASISRKRLTSGISRTLISPSSHSTKNISFTLSLTIALSLSLPLHPIFWKVWLGDVSANVIFSECTFTSEVKWQGKAPVILLSYLRLCINV